MTGVQVELNNRLKILCVDDSQDNSELIGFILSEEGYQVELAGSVAEGLRAAQQSKFALYLLDLSFEDGTGFNLLERIRAFDPLTPFVICSGNVRPFASEKVTLAEVRAYLLKPVDPEILVQTVAAVLGNRTSNSQKLEDVEGTNDY